MGKLLFGDRLENVLSYSEYKKVLESTKNNLLRRHRTAKQFTYIKALDENE
jgi:hypothetical protein